MNKANIGNLKIGDEVSIMVYNPPLKAKIADMYYLPFEQVPMDEPSLVEKYYGKNVPIVEVFIDGKIRSFISEVVKKV
jgi:hypothetical protein